MWDRPTHTGIAAHCRNVYGVDVADITVRDVMRRLKGHWAQGYRSGPRGVAVQALRLPQCKAAIVVMAMDDLGFFLTHPPGHPGFHPWAAQMARVAQLLRIGNLTAIAEEKRRLQAGS